MSLKDPIWRSNKIKHIETLKSPSKAQKLILDLSKITSPSPAETRNLDTLFRAELAREKFEEVGKRATKLARTAAEQKDKTARQIRNKRLIDHGLLIELAGLHERSEAELLGLVLAAAQVTDLERLASWAKAGAERLAARDAARAKA